MSRLISDLQNILSQMIAEQQKLLHQMELQHTAMKKIDLPAMSEVMSQEEATRLRLTTLDNRRRALVRQIVPGNKNSPEPTLTKIAELFPAQADALLKQRNELRAMIKQINQRSQLSSRLTAAVLGTLNTVGRLISNAIARAGIYNKQGVRQMSQRIGVMEAVG